MTERVVVIGADAAGMSAASQAKRMRGDDLEVVALERGSHTSYSACGIPYWIGGDVGSVDDLVARTPEQHRANGIDLRLRSEATALDMDRREVEVRDHEGAKTYRVGFDHLVLATGARPRRPDIPGIDAPAVLGVQTLDDGERALGGPGGLAAARGGGGRRLHRHRDGRGDGQPRPHGHRGRRARRSRWPPSTRTWAGWCTRRWRAWASTCGRRSTWRRSRPTPTVGCGPSSPATGRSRPTWSCWAPAWGRRRRSPRRRG